jgi:hypothetical protein
MDILVRVARRELLIALASVADAASLLRLLMLRSPPEILGPVGPPVKVESVQGGEFREQGRSGRR